MSDIKLYSLDATEIDCFGNWLLYPQSPAEKLIPSFKKTGQLVPVLLAKDGDKNVLIAGRARVLAAEKLGQKVNAIFVEAADDISRAIMHLEENRSRVADDAFKLATFRFFSARMETSALPKELGPLLDIKPKSRDMKLWLDWMEMDSKFDEMLVAGNIPLAAVSVLSKLSSEDCNSLIPFFEKVSWSRSNAVNFLPGFMRQHVVKSKVLLIFLKKQVLLRQRRMNLLKTRLQDFVNRRSSYASLILVNCRKPMRKLYLKFALELNGVLSLSAILKQAKL